MERQGQFRQWCGIAAVVVAGLGLSSCAGDLARQGDSPAYLVINSLTAASGAEPGTFSNFLNSDVQTIVSDVPTVFNDVGRAAFTLALKAPGPTGSPTTPSSLNAITVERYRVEFTRADGRNTPGVDIPYGFDGGVSGTVTAGASVTLSFELVRHVMKEEPPLRNLVGLRGQGLIYTLATITFYGHDQAGNAVSVSGTISVNFGDFGDPA